MRIPQICLWTRGLQAELQQQLMPLTCMTGFSLWQLLYFPEGHSYKDHTDRTPPKEKLPVSLILAQVLAANFVLGRVSPITILIVTSTVQHNEFLSPEGTEKFATFLVPTHFITSNTIIFNVRFEILMMSWYYIYFPLYKFHFFNH